MTVHTPDVRELTSIRTGVLSVLLDFIFSLVLFTGTLRAGHGPLSVCRCLVCLDQGQEDLGSQTTPVTTSILSVYLMSFSEVVHDTSFSSPLSNYSLDEITTSRPSQKNSLTVNSTINFEFIFN